MPTPDRNTQPLDGTGEAACGASAERDTATGAAWLSVSDAAARLGIGARAVQQRAERGTITARRVKHGRALRWEIDASSVPLELRELDAREGEKAGGSASQDVRKAFAKPSPDVRAKVPFERGDVRETFADRSQDVRAIDADFHAHLIGENKFLRAALEQRDRDAAELRAALRAALKLTAGDATPQLAAKPETAPPFETRDGARAGAASGAVASSGATETLERAAPLTYGDIADQLERDLEARNSK